VQQALQNCASRWNRNTFFQRIAVFLFAKQNKKPYLYAHNLAKVRFQKTLFYEKIRFSRTKISDAFDY